LQFWVLFLWTVRKCKALPFLVHCTCVHKIGVTAGAFMVSLSTLQTFDILQSTYKGIRWTRMVSVMHGIIFLILTAEYGSFPWFSRVSPAEWWNCGMADWRNGGMAEWRIGGMAEWRNGIMANGMSEWRNGRQND
jgi:hypothetical protein